MWTAVVLGLIWLVDPYGISPFKLAVPGFNEIKPARLDIDRQLKPIEVWMKQPKTVFLGTSRIHESMDPAVLDGTAMAPAYNAAIPASVYAENLAHLELYFQLAPGIENVILEAFPYQLIVPQHDVPARRISTTLGDAASMTFSWSAIDASLKTLSANRRPEDAGAWVAPGGYWIPAARFEGSFTKEDFIRNILEGHLARGDMPLEPSAFKALQEIIDLCDRKGAKLTILLTPNYPWDDYRLLSLGYWSWLEDVYRQLSSFPYVVSAAQYNDMIEEPSGLNMKWWYDPIHFNRNFGAVLLKALSGQPVDVPDDFLVALTPENAAALVAQRRAAAEAWAAGHREFVEAFEAGKRNAGGPVDRRP